MNDITDSTSEMPPSYFFGIPLEVRDRLDDQFLVDFCRLSIIEEHDTVSRPVAAMNRNIARCWNVGHPTEPTQLEPADISTEFV